ncbi:MAG: MarC family protein [Roseiarcus sp.]|jgi:multiple antibiotic resistance protein
MNQRRPFLNEDGIRLRLWRRALGLTALAVSVGCLVDASVASAAEAVGGAAQIKSIPLAQIFTFLFLMLGPFKIIGPFAGLTRGADAGLSRQIAIRALAYSTVALLLAALLGETILDKYGISLPILALAAGIILFLVALQNMLQQFAPLTPNDREAAAPTLSVAMTPLAFPTIVTPYGISALIVFLALSPDLQSRLLIGVIVLAIMALNLVAMLLARPLLRFLGVFLQILGAVLSVVQVALGLQIISSSLRMLWGS